ncbi:hypothetical protein IWZ00DRAFT_486650 [Phyllosticta capitalensis]|uniref:uncharacterized protein n=1 Tax=Phyllosticta capitalensis TaxID=121624 RepID=UPI00312D39CB
MAVKRVVLLTARAGRCAEVAVCCQLFQASLPDTQGSGNSSKPQRRACGAEAAAVGQSNLEVSISPASCSRSLLRHNYLPYAVARRTPARCFLAALEQQQQQQHKAADNLSVGRLITPESLQLT